MYTLLNSPILLTIGLLLLSPGVSAWDHADVREGINAHTAAESADGRYVIMADDLPNALLLLDASTLEPIKSFDVMDRDENRSRVSAVYTAAPRDSFIAALTDIPELWQISYADDPPIGFDGWVHDYRFDSGENVKPPPFPVRRIKLDNPLDDLFLDDECVVLVGVSPQGSAQVVDLDLGRIVVAGLELPPMPHPGGAMAWEHGGKPVLAVPNSKEGIVSVLDMESWKTIRQIETAGPGSFRQGPGDAPFAEFEIIAGPDQGSIVVIDKRTLEVVR